MREFAVVMLLVVATMIDVYGVLLPRKLRAQGAGGTALLLSPIGVAVLLPAFWSGLPLLLNARSSCLAGLVQARGFATVSRMWACASVEDRREAARLAALGEQGEIGQTGCSKDGQSSKDSINSGPHFLRLKSILRPLA